MLRLAARPPFDARPLLRFLAGRAISGVEQARASVYARSIDVDGASGVLELRTIPGDTALRMTMSAPCSPRVRQAVAGRARRMLDLDADAVGIAAHLLEDPALESFVPRTGIRIAGGWDPFEVGVRALLGQQISVAAARTIAARLVRLCGMPLAEPRGPITHVFPEAEAVAGAADLDSIGLPRARAAALRAFAEAVACGRIDFAAANDLEAFVRTLTDLPGIGPWTAHYIAMRGLGHPDAFPASDLGVRKALALDGRLPTERETVARAERWRPWRAYAVFALWAWHVERHVEGRT